ncbi:MAG TPA: hypothetical protein VFV70_01310 [Hyphomonadaceae bacterium]|nr:hypothetical protein [Hyphomonadaceae bacterium]
MTPDQQNLRELISLAFQICELRAKLVTCQSKLIERSAIAAVDRDAEEIIDAAGRSERELTSIASAILRRMDAEGAEVVLACPLNKYEEAHFDMARKHAAAIDDYCARMAN